MAGCNLWHAIHLGHFLWGMERSEMQGITENMSSNEDNYGTGSFFRSVACPGSTFNLAI
jgi:hypothetical protein